MFSISFCGEATKEATQRHHRQSAAPADIGRGTPPGDALFIRRASLRSRGPVRRGPDSWRRAASTRGSPLTRSSRPRRSARLRSRATNATPSASPPISGCSSRRRGPATTPRVRCGPHWVAAPASKTPPSRPCAEERASSGASSHVALACIAGRRAFAHKPSDSYLRSARRRRPHRRAMGHRAARSRFLRSASTPMATARLPGAR